MKLQKILKSKSKSFDWVKVFSLVAIETIAPIMLVTLITNNPTLAQITPDGTLGNESSRVTRDVTVKGGTADLIEGGALRGSSLFHSFTQFNVNDGKRVYFGNPTGIENIFSRVTGNSVSNILGTLGVNGSANLFLLNPNGILFGKNAQLDIQGSFLATTANSFKFRDGSEFSATNPQAPQLLTMSVPVGVQYGSQPTASITNQGKLVTGKDLTLSAGNLDLQGQLQAGSNLTLQAQDTLKVRDSVSNPFIAAANGKMVVQGNKKVDIFALNHPNSRFFSGGDIDINSKSGQIDIAGNINSTNPKGLAGDITIEAAGNINVRNSTIKASFVNDEPTDKPQNYSTIKINSNKGSVYLDGSTLDTSNSRSGVAGNIIIDAKDNIYILHSKISSEGNNGWILIGDTSDIPKSVTIDNSVLSTDALNGGNAGYINISALAEVLIKNSSIYSGIVDKNNPENNANNQANGGDIFIKSEGLVRLEASRIFSDIISPDQNGKAGEINISSDSLILDKGSELNTSTNGQGNAGDINITVRNLLLLRDRSNIITTGNPGNGGNININENAKAGFVIAVPSENSNIIADAFGGKGGKINIRANRIIGFQNAQKQGNLNKKQLEAIKTNGISNITASSDIGEDGEVSLDTLSIDPSEGLVALPTDLIDPSGLIAQGCGAGNGGVAKGQSEFVITGRGGLPPSPEDALSAGAVSGDWVNRDTSTLSNNNEKNPVKAANLIEFSSGAATPLVEAVGIVRNSNGDIVLTAKPTTATQLQSGLSSTFCSVSQK